MTLEHPNVIQMWPARDYAERFDETARMAAIEAELRRDLRVMRWQARVQWGSIVLAIGTVVYFCFELGRGAF